MTTCCLAQYKTDSLLQLLPSLPEDTLRVKALANLGFSFWASEPQQGIPYATEALQLAEKLDYATGRATAFNSLGVLQWALGNYSVAIDYYKQSLVWAERENDEEAAARVYNNLAMIYSRIKSYDDALHFYGKVLASDEKRQDSLGMALSLNNIGLAYLDMGEYDQSLDALNRSLEIYRRMNNETTIAQTLSNIGLNYCKRGMLEEGLGFCKKAEAYYLNTDSKRGRAILYTNMGNAYTALHNFSLAESYFEKGLALALEQENKEQASELYLGLSKLDSLKGDASGAYINLKKHYDYQMALYAHNHARELSDFRARFEMQEKEKENELLREKAELQSAYLKQQRYALAGLVVLLIIVSVGAFHSYQHFLSKKKANKALIRLNEQIMNQQEQLRKANEEIRAVNDNLENLVRKRSEKIEYQNQQLTEYAFFNAHKVRGPLARILGIVHLIGLNAPGHRDEDLIEMLKNAAEELDRTIKEINNVLESSPGEVE